MLLPLTAGAQEASSIFPEERPCDSVITIDSRCLGLPEDSPARPPQCRGGIRNYGRAQKCVDETGVERTLRSYGVEPAVYTGCGSSSGGTCEIPRDELCRPVEVIGGTSYDYMGLNGNGMKAPLRDRGN